MSENRSNLNGLLLIDKPVGCTSHDVVAQARRILQNRSIGHAGTLDPLASGLLVLLLGDGTKLSNFILNGDKGYDVKVKFGIETATFDREGAVTREVPNVRISREKIQEILREFEGELDLEVPIYSAVKVQGKKLYEEARQGRDVQPPIKKMRFYDVQLAESGDDWFKVSLKCSKGSFIRAWVNAIGKRVEVGAVVDELRRTWSSPYSSSESVTLEALRMDDAGRVENGFISLVEALPDWPSMVVEGFEQKLLLNGQISHSLKGRLKPYAARFSGPGSNMGIKVVTAGRKSLLALLTADERGLFSIGRVFPPKFP